MAIDPAITVANPIFQSGIKQAMKNKSPLIGLFTNTGWKDEMIIRIPICEKNCQNSTTK